MPLNDAGRRRALGQLGAVAGWAVGPFGAATAAAPRVLQLGHGLSSSSHQGLAVQAFADDVSHRSAGRLKVRAFADGVLGTDVQMQQGLIAGTQDMMVGATATLVGLVRQMALWDTPFLFDSAEQADALLDGPIGESVLVDLLAKGLVGLCYWENGFRHVTNNRGPIRRHEDLGGLSIRVMQNAVYLASFKELGAAPVPLPFSDVMTGLESGTFSGQEDPVNTVLAAGLFGVQKYLSLTGHAYSPWLLSIGRRSWQQLNDAERRVLRDAALASRRAQREASRAMVAPTLASLAERGMVINSLSDGEGARMRARLGRIHASVAGSIGMPLWQQTQAQLALTRRN